MKITQLTPENRMLMAQIKEEWLSHFYSGLPMNKQIVEKSIEWLYGAAKLKKPRIIYVDSPYMAQYAANLIVLLLKKYRHKQNLKNEVENEVRKEVRNEVRNEVENEVRNEVRKEVRNEVSNEVGNEVGNEVWNEVENEVWNEVGNEVWNEVENEVRKEVRNEVRNEVWDEVGKEVRGEVEKWSTASKIITNYYAFAWYLSVQDYGWLAFYDYFDRLGIFNGHRVQESLRKCKRLLLEGNIYDMIQFKGFCIVISLPTAVHRDAMNRLHNMSGHAVHFRDGYGIYRIHGVSFPIQQYNDFVSGKITAIEIMTEQNQDRKRAMILEYGNEKLIRELQAKKISEEVDNQGNPMRIWVIDRKNDNSMVFYEGMCPSKRETVYLRIPSEFKDKRPLEAKIWTFAPLWGEYQKTGIIPEFIIET